MTPLRAAFCVLALVALALLPSSRALAQDDSMDVEARAMFQAGTTAFQAGRYADALIDFQRAYELSHRPALLYNIGMCEDRMRHDDRALWAFQSFLDAEPTTDHRTELEGRIAALRAAITARGETPPPPPTPIDLGATTSSGSATSPQAEPPHVQAAEPSSPTPSVSPTSPATPSSTDGDSGPGAGPWVLVGVGGALAVGGAILLGLGIADANTVNNAPLDGAWSGYRDAAERSPIFEGAGIAGLGVGVVLAVVGLAWGLTATGSPRTTARRPHLLTFSF